MIFSLLKDPLSYFKSYAKYFVAIYAAFAVFPVSDLALIFLSQSGQPAFLRLALQAYVTAGVTIAAIWGYVATKLYLYPEPFSWRRVITNIERPVFLFLTLYLLPMALGGIIVWADPASVYTDPTVKVTYVIDNVLLPSAVLGPLLLVLGLCVVIAFSLYPFLVLTRLRSEIKDREVRAALKTFALAFAAIAIVLFIAVGLASQGYSIRASANVVSVLLLIVAVRAFRKPTFLKSFLGVVPSLESSPLISHVDQMVLFYGSEIDKLGPISKYIIDGVSQENRVFYFHDGDDVQLRTDLSDHGLDVRQYMLKGLLTIAPLGSLYQSRGRVDDTAIEYCLQLVSDARKLGNRGIKIILDFDDFTIRPLQRFVAHLADRRWTTIDHYTHVLMAFRTGAFHSDEAALNELRSKVRILDLSESMNLFSRTVGLSHSEIVGQKILLEFDPQSDYEKILKGILGESASNFERTVVFTRKGSPVHSLAQRQPGAKIFVLTSRVSYPKIESDNRVLLPSYDSSLLLDSLNRTIEVYQGSSFMILFDDISHWLFGLGLDRTYSIARQAMELMASNNITSIFSINSKAHDQKTLSTFENLFDMEIICNAGARVPEIRRKTPVAAT